MIVTEMDWSEQDGHTKPDGFEAYIKPLRTIHSSGYRIFEIGYCKIDGKNRVSEKIVLGECSDHIWLCESDIGHISLSMDCTKDGYIRLFSNIVWEHALSSAQFHQVMDTKK